MSMCSWFILKAALTFIMSQVNLFIFQDSDLHRFLNRVLHFAVSIVAQSIAAIDSQANMHFPEASQQRHPPYLRYLKCFK